MKYSIVIVGLAASFAAAAPAPSNEKLHERGGGPLCLEFCAPLAPTWPAYAACLATCLGAATGPEPVETGEVSKAD